MRVGRSAEKLKSTRKRLAADAELAHYFADAADEAANAAAIDAAIEAFGGV
jgi:hypothetical protein